MMIDSRARFAASAEHYDRHRPSYPAALIDWIIATTGRRPPAHVADIGCGTGIATRLFGERGFETVGVDPSEEMLAVARESGGPRYVRGEAKDTTLATGSVDLVIAAQCFHWFDVVPTLHEFRRILRATGWVAAFWNLRGHTPFMRGYYDLIRSYSSEFDVLERQEAAPAALKAVIGIDACREAEFANTQVLDHEGLVGRAYSSSCVKHGVLDKAGFERGLAGLFAQHRRDGNVELTYRTVALCYRPD